jgi:hypothetical protein
MSNASRRPAADKPEAINANPLVLTYRATGTLKPDPRNARTHSKAQVGQIVASIKEFGFTNPILIDPDRGIIAGHGRLLAAKALNMVEVPTIELAGLTEAQKRRYGSPITKLRSAPAGTSSSSRRSSPSFPRSTLAWT